MPSVLVNGSIKNLINGISQQSDNLRLPTQCTNQINGYSSVVEGLKKRPPLEHVAKLKSTAVDGVSIQFIDRGDAIERYVAIIYDTDLEVYKLDGTSKTIDFPDGKSYLAATVPLTSFRAVTVADYTFVVNKTIAPVMDTASFSPQNDVSGLVFVKQAVNGVDYKVTIAGTSYTHTTSASGAVSTSVIAAALATTIGTGPGGNYTVTRSNYVLKIKNNLAASFTLDVEDSRSGDSLKSVKGQIQKFSELPVVAPDGYIIEVRGDNTSAFDNYFVKFVAHDTGAFGEGTWEETVGPNINYKLDSTKMPHVLVRESSGDFTFRKQTWGERTAGDANSAANPSFVGSTINDVFFFKNRLGFLSDENVIMSKAGSFFQFFPDTVTTTLDDAPIDVASTSNKVTFLRHAVPFDKQVLLYSDEVQFKMLGGDILTAKTISIDPLTEYKSLKNCRPIVVGDNVYFPANNGGFSTLWEYFVDSQNTTKKAASITSHVPKYVPSDLKKLTGNVTESVFCCLSDDEPQSLYAYKFYWGEEDSKLQSSWSKWTFDSDISILDIEFFENYLYMVYTKSNGTFLGKMNISPKVTDTDMNYLTHLDLKITDEDCTVSYNSGTNRTTYTLPYDIGETADMVVVSRYSEDGLPNGVLIPIVSQGTDTLVVTGDQTDQPVFIGCNYEFRYEFSHAYVREKSEKGGSVIQEGRLQVAKWIVSYEGTGYFEAWVTPNYRDTSVFYMNGTTLGESGFLLGDVQLADGNKEFPILSKNTQVKIELVNNTYRPCQFLNAEWTGRFTGKTQQRV
jgi:hypothetical protein